MAWDHHVWWECFSWYTTNGIYMDIRGSTITASVSRSAYHTTGLELFREWLLHGLYTLENE